MTLPAEHPRQDCFLRVRLGTNDASSEGEWLQLGPGSWTVGSDWACDILAPACSVPRVVTLMLEGNEASLRALADGVTVDGADVPAGMQVWLSGQAAVGGAGVDLLVSPVVRGLGAEPPSGPPWTTLARALPAGMARPAAFALVAVLAGVAASVVIAVAPDRQPAIAASSPAAPEHARPMLGDASSVSNVVAEGLARIGSPFHASTRDDRVVVEGLGSSRDMTLARALVGDVQSATPVPIALAGAEPGEVHMPVAFVIAGRVAELQTGERLRPGDELDKGWRVQLIGSDEIRLRRADAERSIAGWSAPGLPGAQADRVATREREEKSLSMK
jgi:hypothetical protein